MAEHTRGPDDIPDRRAIRFGLRGKHDIVDCYVAWEALDRLEDSPAANRNERLDRFEMHRPVIEAAALAKLGDSDRTITLDVDDVLGETGA
jgi:hypothetical protein